MRLYRTNSDKDQKAIAADIGIPAKTLSRLESGKNIDQQATIKIKIMAWLFKEEKENE